MDNPTNMMNDLKHIISNEGITGLYRGVTIRMMYLTVGGFTFFGVYENAKIYLSSYLI